MKGVGLFVALVFGAQPQPSWSQQSPPAPVPAEDVSYELSEVVVIASGPGVDPSSATTECLWEHLQTDQRSALTARAEHAVRTLAHHDDLPLANPSLTDAAVTVSLRACGGSEKPSALPFARTALLAFAAERATAARLGGDRLYQPRLDQGWASLTPVQRNVLLRASVLADGEIPKEIEDDLVSAVFKLLRTVRPVGVWNPLAYRNGTATHRVVYYYQALSVRTAMERRF